MFPSEGETVRKLLVGAAILALAGIGLPTVFAGIEKQAACACSEGCTCGSDCACATGGRCSEGCGCEMTCTCSDECGCGTKCACTPDDLCNTDCGCGVDQPATGCGAMSGTGCGCM